jgi:heptosyltransferase I
MSCEGSRPEAVRILVVRLGAMGDVIHALPAVASLKRGIPGARVTWAVAPLWAPLLDGNPDVDRVISVDRKSLAGLRRAHRELRSEPFDRAVDFQGLLKSALVARAARPARIFGFDASIARESAAAMLYTDSAVSDAAHVVDRNLDLAHAAGAARRVVDFPLPDGEPGQPLPDGDFVLACPLAGWAAKQWPLEAYTELALRLERELKLPLVVNGPPSAAEALGGIAATHTHLSGVPGLIHATRRAVAVVGVDSGPVHLAAALGKPGVAIFGPTDPARNGPYGASIRVLRSPAASTTYKRRDEIDASMRDISPSDVFAALETQLLPST